MEEMRIKTICSLQTRKAMACAQNLANQPWMKSSTCRTAHTWKKHDTWLLIGRIAFLTCGKAIRDIWLVYIGLRTKIYSAAFQCVNLSMYIINYFIQVLLYWEIAKFTLVTLKLHDYCLLSRNDNFCFHSFCPTHSGLFSLHSLMMMQISKSLESKD